MRPAIMHLKAPAAFRFALAVAAALTLALLFFNAPSRSHANRSVVSALPAADFSSYNDEAAAAAELLNAREGSVSDMISAMESGGSFITLFAFSSCPYCNAAIPAMSEALDDMGSEVLYINTRSDPSWESNLDIDGYGQLVSIVGDRLPLDEDGREHLYVPHLFFIRDGNVVADVAGLGGDDASLDSFARGSEAWCAYAGEVKAAAELIA